ncbi:hypothetical protein GCM10022280_18700 [Sphingomonas swuensis]|uniref:Zorya protein ZorC EH domain-containing protein n=1 Tax=Sphingomonas swuensis TaxID=977800 RepID=A0ABP7T143_9SPHN
MTGRFTKAIEGLKGCAAIAVDLPRHVIADTQMSAVRERLENLFELPVAPGEEELRRLLRLFIAWCEKKGRAPSDDEWSLAPWIALQGTPALITREPFGRHLEERLELERSPRLLRALIYSYIRDYRPGNPEAARAGDLISRNLTRHTSPVAIRWRERTSTVRLFEAVGAHRRIFTAALNNGGNVKSLMRELGFTTELVTRSGFHQPVAEVVATSLVAELTRNPEFPVEAVQQALSFLRMGSELTFPGLRVQIADTFLSPFAHKELRNLPARAALMQFFDEIYGDPRSHKKQWVGVSQEARKTITRWLSRKALDLFFDILSATADPIWRWRRAFWLALERHGAIDEAWPVFGMEARHFLVRHPEKKAKVVASGRLQGAGRRQSVMLMRIGKFVVAEWSHAGSARVWAEDDERAPQLQEPYYSAQELREDCLYDQRHDSTMAYRWQRELMDFLAPRIGVRVSVAEMRP